MAHGNPEAVVVRHEPLGALGAQHGNLDVTKSSARAISGCALMAAPISRLTGSVYVNAVSRPRPPCRRNLGPEFGVCGK